jgi:FeS assembly SUF system protein
MNENIISLSDEDMKTLVVDVLKSCYDPEIPVDIYELGLIYNIDVQPGGVVRVDMTLTAPSCPVAGTLPGEVERKLLATPGINDVKVELTWEPPWDKERMSEVAKLALGMW